MVGKNEATYIRVSIFVKVTDGRFIGGEDAILVFLDMTYPEEGREEKRSNTATWINEASPANKRRVSMVGRTRRNIL
jgi:hypothetical protein